MGPVGFEPTTSRLSAGCSSQTKLWARSCSTILRMVGTLYPQLTRAPGSVAERKEVLLADPRVKRWFKSRRSERTAHTQFSQLELFLRRASLDVGELLELGRDQSSHKPREFEDAVITWIDTERKAGRPEAYIAASWAAIRSFLKHEEAAPAWAPKFRIRSAETLVSGIVPTPEQLRAVLDRSPVPRVRALGPFLATSGIRIGALGARFSENGPRLRNPPGLKLDPEPHFDRFPFKVEIPSDLSKGVTHASASGPKRPTPSYASTSESGSDAARSSGPTPRCSRRNRRLRPFIFVGRRTVSHSFPRADSPTRSGSPSRRSFPRGSGGVRTSFVLSPAPSSCPPKTRGFCRETFANSFSVMRSTSRAGTTSGSRG